jgi:hypothetical protein
MRRLPVSGLIVCVSFVAVFGVAARPDALAQESTPASGSAVVGVTTEALGLGTAQLAWPDRALASVSLFRFRFEPGAYIRIPAGQQGAGLGLVYVESGTLRVRSTEPLFIAQAAEMTQPGGQAATPVAANAEVTLAAGDSFVLSGTADSSAGIEMRNEGSIETSLLTVGVSPFDTGTPTP